MKGVTLQDPTEGEPAAAPRPVLEHREPRVLQARRSAPAHPRQERGGVGAGGPPFASREASRQTVSRLRPLARRRFNTFRPPLVFIRSRKPCVFFRRRTFG